MCINSKSWLLHQNPTTTFYCFAIKILETVVLRCICSESSKVIAHKSSANVFYHLQLQPLFIFSFSVHATRKYLPSLIGNRGGNEGAERNRLLSNGTKSHVYDLFKTRLLADYKTGSFLSLVVD